MYTILTFKVSQTFIKIFECCTGNKNTLLKYISPNSHLANYLSVSQSITLNNNIYHRK